MTYPKFDLDAALAGKPFGRIQDGKFIKAKDIHVIPDWWCDTYNVYVLFEDGYINNYSKYTIGLVMMPEAVVEYRNVYSDDYSGSWHPLLEVCKIAAGINKIDCILKRTTIGDDVTIEIIKQ